MNDYLFDNTPRGIRNNNWLNIKFNPRNHWRGQVGNDGSFCIFCYPVFGIRAARKILKSYLKRKPDMTLKDFIYTWSSTDQEKYLNFVFRHCATFVLPWYKMSSFDSFQLAYIFKYMAIFENGSHFDYIFDFNLIHSGIVML